MLSLIIKFFYSKLRHMKISFYKLPGFLIFFICCLISLEIFANDDDDIIAKNKAEFYALTNVYRLRDVKAVDYTGKLTAEAMKNFSEEAQGEYKSKDFAFDPATNTLYICSRASTFYKVLKLEKNDKVLKYSRCTTCDPLEFVIKLQSDSELILDVDSPDGKGFVFQYAFSK